MKTKFNQLKNIVASTALSTRVVPGRLVIAAHAQSRRNRRLLLFRAFALALVTLLVLHVFAPLCRGQETPSWFKETPSLMTMVVRWQYPNSTFTNNKPGQLAMTSAVTMNAAGELLPSIQYKAVWATKDPMAKVIAYYETKLKPAADPGTVKPDRVVTFQDDTEGRPLAVHVILVNTDTTSTTLVISRAATESETHVAWMHYVDITRRPALEGKPLPDLAALGLAATDAPADQPVVVLLIDAEQRPSRGALKVLTDHAGALKEKHVAVIILQAGSMADAAYAAWLKEAALPFPVARPKDTSEKGRSAWGAASLPWLILAVKSHRVAAEGFSIEELDAKLNELAK